MQDSKFDILIYMKYVSLLRGINVGGNRKVPMAQLKQVFEGMGFGDVSTYINSGNVIFSAATKPNTATIEQRLALHFGFAIDTLVLSAAELASVADAIPGEWANDTEQKSDVAFLFPDVDSPDIVQTIGHKPDIETMRYVPGALLMNISRQNQSKGSLLKIVSMPLYRRMTLRNVTTVRRLAELVWQ